jgi:hypothetical protein
MGLGMSMALLFGCDRSNTVSEIPEESRKALIQRKVDVKPGQANSSRTGGSLTKGRASGR